MTIRVLIVEDEKVAAQAHTEYIERIEGFEVAAVARSAVQAIRLLGQDSSVELILLDMRLPDGHGLDLLRRVRAAGNVCDVIAVTSAKDVDVVKNAVAQGVMLYLLKPFTFAAFRSKLEQYASYRRQMSTAAGDIAQDEVDQMFGVLRETPGSTPLPKGMSQETLRAVRSALRTADTGLSSSEVARQLSSSRVTARRYLEHLADTGFADRHTRYGRSGRPEVEYRWHSG